MFLNKDLRHYKYVIIALATAVLALVEFIYYLLNRAPLSHILVDFSLGFIFIVFFSLLGFQGIGRVQKQLRSEIAERESAEAKLRLRSSALEAAANAIVITDRDGRFQWANPAFSKLTGYTVEEVIGQYPSLLKSGKHDAAFYENLWRVITSGEVWHDELINRKKDGSLYTEEQTITPVTNDNGEITHFIGIKQDISERKKAERTLQQYTERLQLVHTIDQSILSKQSPKEIAQAALSVISQIIPCTRASVLVFDEQLTEGTVLALYTRGETAVPEGATLSFEDLGAFITRQNQANTIITTPSSTKELSTVLGKKLQQEGIGTYINIPLIAQETLIGFFNFGTEKQNTFTPEHINIAREIATSLAIALQQAKLYLTERRQREQAEALRETGEALSATLDFDEVFHLLLQQLPRIIPHDSAHIILIKGGIASIHHARKYDRYGSTIAEKTSNLSFTISKTPNLNWIVQHQEPMTIPDVQQYEGWRRDKGLAQIRSWVGVPVFVNGKIVAIFSLSKQVENFYQESHVQTLRILASQTGLALENARLYEKLRTHADELENRVRTRTHALAKANERLQELDRLKSKFISDVSHELRTPITNVNMYLDLLEHGREQKKEHYMMVLKQETLRLTQLIEDIFDESQYTTYLRQTKYVPVDVNDLIRQTVRIFANDVMEAGLSLDCDLEKNLFPVLGDPFQLNQVLANLLKNAINYTPEGNIYIQTINQDDFVLISIKDTGIGIAPEDIPHLFERFYRGRYTSQSTIPGTGLGLGVVREIITLHGGVVRVRNNPNGGVTFQTRLPAYHQTEQPLAVPPAQRNAD